MKTILEFNLPEEKEDLQDALNGTKHKHMFAEIWQKMFRPYYKHGFSSENLNNALQEKAGQIVFEELESIYKEIADEYEGEY